MDRADGERARFWFAVMNELKARGLQDVRIVVVDGLKGFPEAIESLDPEAVVQTCIVHLIRHSLAPALAGRVVEGSAKALASAVNAVYQAPTEAAAAMAAVGHSVDQDAPRYDGMNWRPATAQPRVAHARNS